MNRRQLSTDPDRYYIFLPGSLYNIKIKTPLTQKSTQIKIWINDLGWMCDFSQTKHHYTITLFWCTGKILHNPTTTTNTHNHRRTHSPNNTTPKTNTPPPQTLSHAYVPSLEQHKKCVGNALFPVSGLPITRAKHKSHVDKPTHKNIDTGLRTIDTYIKNINFTKYIISQHQHIQLKPPLIKLKTPWVNSSSNHQH